jgi:predicted DNA-binding transcriptional regulator AlpA
MTNINDDGDPDRLISEDEVAKFLNVSKPTLQRMDQRGEGPPRLRLGLRRVNYRCGDVRTYAQNLKPRARPA